ncbi:MAG: hypothetical protein H0V66_04500 [Bdellovibrionales bacterium]|nr:hypothetical protein [Bdellovibrionales bacterium]
MDYIDLMVAETFKHLQENFSQAEATPVPVVPESNEEINEYPSGPGVLYHLQKSTSLFVIRTLVSQNIREDYQKIIDNPGEYPSLRLVDEEMIDLEKKLRFFILDNHLQAEIIHDQISNRRFPVDEESMCNLSDPGFSWWLTKKINGFQISFTLSVASGEDTVKLGPVGDQQMAMRSFQLMESLMQKAGLDLNIQNETNRVQFNDGEEFLLEELKDLFEFGVIGEGMENLFKLLARRISDHSQLETLWLYLQEIAAMRRFWIQIQYDLGND